MVLFGAFFAFFLAEKLTRETPFSVRAEGGQVGSRRCQKPVTEGDHGWKRRCRKTQILLVSCDSGISTMCSASEASVCVRISLRGAARCSRGKYLRQQRNLMLLGCSETPRTGAEGAEHHQTDRAAYTDTKNEIHSSLLQRQ